MADPFDIGPIRFHPNAVPSEGEILKFAPILLARAQVVPVDVEIRLTIHCPMCDQEYESGTVHGHDECVVRQVLES